MGEKSMQKTDVPIRTADLRRMFSCYSAVSGDPKADEIVLKGSFRHSLNTEGLSMHACDLIEMRDMSSCVDLPAALSFNIVFHGQVDFSVGHHRYRLGNNLPDSVECSAIVLNQPEVMVRRLKKGMHVRKVNMFVERRWLEARVCTEGEKQRLARLFERHNAFHFWRPSPRLVKRARKLLEIDSEISLNHRLRSESLAIELVSCCIDELERTDRQASPSPGSKQARTGAGKQLKQQVDEMLSEVACLSEIAEELGLSISTLQRKFKADYGVTVNSYCRQRRLDMAKRALVIEGKSIGEAAYLAGYKHPSNFIAAFKKRFELTPTELIRISRW